MKTFLISLIVILGWLSTQAKTDTLSYYDPTGNEIGIFQKPKGILARFYTPYPGIVKTIRFKVSGSKNSQVTVHLYGHEGGTQTPQRDPRGSFYYQYLENKIQPITLSKQTDDPEWLEVSISDTVIFRNNQFFVGFDHYSNDLKVLQNDRPSSHKFCTASTSQGGSMAPTLLIDSVNGSLSGNQLPSLVEVIFESVSSEYHLLEDVTASSGIATGQSNRSIAAADFDNDGDIDLLLRGKLYEMKDSLYEDVTALKGLGGNPAASCFVDIDNDYDLDIFFFDQADTCWVYENRSGNFIKHRITGIPALTAMHSYSFADITGDNLPDLFIAQLWKTYPTGEPNFLLKNDSNFSFVDISTKLYPQHNGTHNFPNNPPQSGIDYRNRRSRGSQFIDYDNDGDLDLYVTNYFLEADEFYRNDGNGNFSDVSGTLKIDRNTGGGSNHGTGVDWADYDNDGDLDLLLPQFAHPGWNNTYGHRGTILYTNSGHPSYTFTEQYDQGNHNIQWEETHAGGTWGDINNDGLLDFYISTYYGCRFVDLYLQKPDHTFELASLEYGVDSIRSGNDALLFDYNSDGLLDIGAGIDNSFHLLENPGFYSGNAVQIRIQRTQKNLTCLGCKVTVNTNDGKSYTQEVGLGRGQMMQKPFTLHFGLGSATSISSVYVQYPLGSGEEFRSLEINHKYYLTEGGTVDKRDSLTKVGVKEPSTHSEIIRNDSPNVMVYPNPSHHVIEIQINASSEVPTQLVLYDMQGKPIKTQKLPSIDSWFKTQMDISDLANGIYLLKIANTQESFKRIVKN